MSIRNMMIGAGGASPPGAPTGVTAASPTISTMSVSFSAPASNGGSAITSFTVTSSPGGVTASGASSPITVTGLTGSTSYTFTVTATNAIGTGPASDPSTAVSTTDELYSFTATTFNTGFGTSHSRSGPTLGQAKDALVGTSITAWKDNTSFFNTDANGIQLWTVPKTGTYEIAAYGAGSNTVTAQRGARIIGNFSLTSGEIIKILVGVRGSEAHPESGSGGTYVVRSPYNTNESILVIAGGAGGTYPALGSNNDNIRGTTNENGNPSENSNGGTAGNGGDNNGVAGATNGSGGGGFFTRGLNGSADNSGDSFINGGLGGATSGFGGGGGTGSNRVGGGGGYSGGGGGGAGAYSGGGGSKNNGTSQTNNSGNNGGNGFVTITRL